jgi:hypothetical protein
MLDQEHVAVRVKDRERGVGSALQCQTLTHVIVFPFGLCNLMLDTSPGVVI